MNKRPDFEALVMQTSPDIIGITESWTHKDILDSEIALDGYNLFRRDRTETRGGGVLLYVRSDITAVVNDNITNELNSESIWCSITTRERQLIIGNCYNSPSASMEEQQNLHAAIREASKHQALIMGDFNHGSINWETLHSDRDDAPFLDLIGDCFMTQHVDKPTRGEAILDLVITTEPGMVENLTIEEHFGSSDHNIVIWDLISETELITNNVMIHDFKKANFDKMRREVDQVDWGKCFEAKSTNGKWCIFKNTILKAMKEFIPMKLKKVRNKPKWLTRYAQNAQNKKHKLWKRYRSTKNQEDYMTYKAAQNIATRELRLARKNFEKKLADNIKTDPKSFYSYTRSKMRTKDKVGPLIDADGHVITDDKIAASQLNSFFTSVFTNENIEDMPKPQQFFQKHSSQQLNDLLLDERKVSESLAHLRPNKAPGDDKILTNVMKELANEAAVPLMRIFQSSLDSAEVPDDWRNANVTPLFKKGKKSLPSNYRPVSLTSIICKTLESLMKSAIVQHLKDHHLIRDSQHGFISGRSCLTNLLEFFELVTSYVDKGLPVDAIYLDFSKAFDKVPHRRLLEKLKAHGITGKIHNWIAAWLTNRRQRVVLNGKFSEWSAVTSGVPQGSVLGPVLFLIYINDIDDHVKSNILKFADDTKIIRPLETEHDIHLLQQDLQQLQQWSSDWQMQFNADKCKSIHFGYNNSRHVYTMDGQSLEQVTEEKDLGIIVTDNLKCGRQVAEAAKKANRILGVINRSIIHKDKKIILQLYKSLVRPHLEYAIQAWNPHLQKDILLLEKVQRRATKMILSLKYLPYEQRLTKLNLTTLDDRRLRGDLIETFKLLNGYEDIDPNKFFTRNRQERTRGHRLKLFAPYARLDCRKYNFNVRVVKHWNKLSEEAVNAVSINTFKGHVDNYVRRGAYTRQYRLPAL